MSPDDERRSCWPRAKYGAGLGRAIWAARRRRHPESLNNRTGSPTEELAGVRIRSGNSVLDNQSAFSAESGLSEVQQPNSLQATLSANHSAKHSAAAVWLWLHSCRYSVQACLSICAEDDRNIPAMTAATARSGQAVEVDQTPKAAIVTTTLPIASLREHSQTERTLASPSL